MNRRARISWSGQKQIGRPADTRRCDSLDSLETEIVIALLIAACLKPLADIPRLQLGDGQLWLLREDQGSGPKEGGKCKRWPIHSNNSKEIRTMMRPLAVLSE